MTLKRIKILILFLALGQFLILSNAQAKEKYTVSECFEGVSRATLKFNMTLDKAIFKPIAKGYRTLPVPVRLATGNAVDNLRSLLTLSNNLLQGDWDLAGNTAGRFAINSTVGILGFLDPAEKMGFEKKSREDFGQTLAVWGSDSGCYFVLPILGPSTVRDTVGMVGSTIGGGDPWYNVTVKNDTQYFTDFDYYGTRTTSGIDFRAKNIESFDNLEKNSMDFYASVRSLYLQDRKLKIANSKKLTDTMDDSNWEEID